jgi:hypothetical protein
MVSEETREQGQTAIMEAKLKMQLAISSHENNQPPLHGITGPKESIYDTLNRD